MIIFISGVDGTGKTTLSKNLAIELSNLKKTKYIYLGDYFILKIFIKFFSFINFINKKKYILNTSKIKKKKKMSFLLLIYYFDYQIHFLYLKLLSLFGYIVICDRSPLDKIAGYMMHNVDIKKFIKFFFKFKFYPDFYIFLHCNYSNSLHRETEGKHEIVFYKNLFSYYIFLLNKIDSHKVIRLNTDDTLDVVSKKLKKIFIDKAF
tara:strand:- start:1588 stop:2205 length:618 start_codon:yes stop_codon:yes gene_type:complete